MQGTVGNRSNERRATYRVQWTIDAGDPSSIPKVRRSVIERLRAIAGKSTDDLFMLEAVVGELLSAETGHGHVALAVIVEEDAKPPLVHIYTQLTNSQAASYGDLREAILNGSHLPMSVETTSQGAHYCLEVPRQKVARNSR